MPSRSITIPVGEQVERAWNAADEAERQKFRLILGFWLAELLAGERRTLDEIMDEVGAKAKARGLTPEILESILTDE